MIYVLGIDGCRDSISMEALLRDASMIFCAGRFLEGLPDYCLPKVRPIVPIRDMLSCLKGHQHEETVVVLTSGDPLYFGIGKRLLSELPLEILNFSPGLTTVQRVCAHFKIPWDDLHVLSLHGRENSLESVLLPFLVEQHGAFKVGIYTDRKNSPDRICRYLMDMGIDGLKVLIAQDIGGPEEAFFSLDLHQAAEMSFHPLNFVILMGKIERPAMPPGIDDDLFVRQKGLITNRNIRMAVLSMLDLPERGIMWDIGAGSGSISVEAALSRPSLMVFAIEREQVRVGDIQDNRRIFSAFNMRIVHGIAPGALKGLPSPNRIFIGGGITAEGCLEYAFDSLKNGGVLVATTILIKSLDRILTFAKANNIRMEAVQFTVSPLRNLGASFMVHPRPPVTVVTLWKD